MHIRQIRATDYKRFADLTVDLPKPVRLVVLAGPNGTGKSSLLDGLKIWSDRVAERGVSGESTYHSRTGQRNFWDQVVVELHEGIPQDQPGRRKMVYFRSAYRNDPDFTVASLDRVGSALEEQMLPRLIDNDQRVARNYQRLVAATVEDIYGGQYDEETIGELKERYIGTIRNAMRTIFPDLILSGPGEPLGGGTFYFQKGTVSMFHYKNLSGGEKAAFDLILDIVIKREQFDDTIYCIDEPEAHLNTRVQGTVLSELLALLPENCQLWIASHSLGMMRVAQAMATAKPESVAFLDFENKEFDRPVTLSPVRPDRAFWSRVLNVALGDLANLVAPRRVVLCEGDPVRGRSQREFDARCYRRIFEQEFPDTDFLSVGNSFVVETDSFGIGRAIQTIVSGTEVIRVIDRDHRSEEEVAGLRAVGVRVLSRRNLEAYLLADDVLLAFAASCGQEDKGEELIRARNDAMRSAHEEKGTDPNDYKAARGPFLVAARKTLKLPFAGSTTDAFLAHTVAPVLRPGLPSYEQLRTDVFG